MMDKPNIKLTQEAQDMIDMFSELDEAECNILSGLLLAGEVQAFGAYFLSRMVLWEEK